MSKIDSILEKSQELISEKKFYEYEQKLKTLSLRYYNMGKVDEANALLLGGSKKLLDSNEVASGLGLAHLMLDSFKAHSKELPSEWKKSLLEIFEKSPYNKQKVDIIMKILKYYTPGEKNKELQLILAKEAYKNKDFGLCQQLLITCDDTLELSIRMLDEYMALGPKEEREYYVTRFVLHKLAAKRLEDARFIYMNYKKTIKTPLMHFLEFLFKTIEAKSQKVLHVIVREYEKPISKDPSFMMFLRTIAEVYFGMEVSNESFGERFFKFLLQ